MNWGSELCPACGVGEVVTASLCKSCYAKKRYQENKEELKAYQRGRYKAKKTPQLQGPVIHIHIHIHLNGGE